MSADLLGLLSARGDCDGWAALADHDADARTNGPRVCAA